MFRLLNKKRMVRHLTRFMHDRNLPDVKPNKPVKQKLVGVKSPNKESRPKIEYSYNFSNYKPKDKDSEDDLLHLMYKNKNNK